MLNKLKNINKDEYKDALRLALQSSLSGALCYYAMVLLGMPEKFVGVLAAVLVIEPSIGNTFQQAKGRLFSTIVGVVIGFVFVALLPFEIGTILSLLLSLFVINGISSFKPEWRYGVVAAVALALSSKPDTFELSIDRILAIGFGVIVGILVSLIIWPDTTEKRAKRYIRKALKNTNNRFKIEFNNTRGNNSKNSTSTLNKNFSKNINLAKKTSKNITFNKNNNIDALIKNTERIYNSVTIIERVAEKSNNNISDEAAGIKKDAEEVKDQISGILENLYYKEKISNDDINKFSSLVENIKNNVKFNKKNKEINILRNTFVFGITEIKECILALKQDLNKDKNQSL